MLFRSRTGQASQGSAVQALADFDKKAEALDGSGSVAGGRGAGAGGGRGGAAESGPDTLSATTGSLTLLMAAIQGADVAPSTQMVAAVAERRSALAHLLARWATLKGPDLSALNATLKAANLPPIVIGHSR